MLVMTVNAACINFHPAPPPIPPGQVGEAPVQHWEVRTARGVTAPMALGDATVLVATSSRRLIGVSLDTGRVAWTVHLPGDATGGILHDGDLYFIGTGRPSGKVVATTAAGQTRWRTSTGNVSAPLGLAEGRILAMTEAGEIVALDRRRGRVLWHRFVGISRTAPVGLDSGRIMVTTLDSLLMLSSDSGRVLSRRAMPGVVLGQWRRVGPWLVGGSTDSAVVALTAGTLDEAWRVRVDAPVTGRLASAADTVWAATRIGTIYRIVAGQATRIARLDWPLTSGVQLIGPDLVLGGADGAIRGLTRDGTERWRVRVWPAVDVSPLALPDGFIAVGGDGDLHRFTR